MTEYSLTIKCESREELDELLAKLDGTVEKEEKPAKKAAKEEDADEKPAKKKAKEPEGDDIKDEIRAALRKLSEATDRKTAMKILNKYAESVDEVDEGDLEELKEKIEAAIEAA
jgi:hypothetical protein